MQAEIYNLDYTQYVHLLGTTHFSRRSLCQADEAVNKLKPTDLAIELDMKRFQMLNKECAKCPQNKRCSHKCEFIGAAEALGNADANIWLIDMTKREFAQRTHMYASRTQIWQVLLDERDTLMAARLAWIGSEALRAKEKPKILAMVGAAHVDGIKPLLRNPQSIRENLQTFELSFSPPTLVRRIRISGD